MPDGLARFRTAVETITRQAEASIEEPGLFSQISADADHVDHIVIERSGDTIYVSQYYTPGGGHVFDNVSVSFELQDDGRWLPIEYRDDGEDILQRDYDGISVGRKLEQWAAHLEEWFVDA